MKKRTMAVLLTMAMAVTMMAGCGSKSDSKTADGEKSYTIGISQFAEHGSLDNCREGFLEGLKEEGIEEGKNLNVEYKNSAADMGTASQIASSFVSDKVDLICGIATPSAQTAYNAAMDTDISVIYTAVTDPKAAELADDKGNPVGEVTGTSDKLPIEAQLKMIRELLPDAKKIGVLYTTSEANSVSAIAEYKEKVGDYGFELVEKGITNTSEIALATDDLLSQVDCISNLTGKMAAKVLKGEKKASEMPFETITEAGLYLNTKVAENLGITVEDDLKNSAVETYDSISEN